LSDNLEDDPEFLMVNSFIILKTINDQIIQSYTEIADREKALASKIVEFDSAESSMIPIVSGNKIEGEFAKEVFEIQFVSEEDSELVYVANSYYTFLFAFFSFVNLWGVGQIIEQDEELDILDKYDVDVCRQEEEMLLNESDKIQEVLISLI
jgi:hypothetical protein